MLLAVLILVRSSVSAVWLCLAQGEMLVRLRDGVQWGSSCFGDKGVTRGLA